MKLILTGKPAVKKTSKNSQLENKPEDTEDNDEDYYNGDLDVDSTDSTSASVNEVIKQTNTPT